MDAAILTSEGRSDAREQAAPAMAVREVRGRDTFRSLETEWNELVEASRPEPFYRHQYLASYIDNFATNSPLRILTGRSHSGRLTAALPLIETRGSIGGIGVRQLESPSNVHSLRFDLVGGGDPKAAVQMFEHLAADQTWEVLRIGDVPPAGNAWGILQAARAAGYPVGVYEAQRSPYITLPSTLAELMDGLRTKFKANLRRRRKRLSEHGRIRVERVAGDDISEGMLDHCFSLEHRSWKGRQGSAVNQNEAVRGFHFALLRNREHRKDLSLFLLSVDGETIAFHYGVTFGRVYSLVMTSYDEAYKEFSPGHLLTEDVLRDCIARGLGEFDFLGCDLPWKLEWTSLIRQHSWLFVFRKNLKGRLLREMKFGWGKTARLLLTRVRS